MFHTFNQTRSGRGSSHSNLLLAAGLLVGSIALSLTGAEARPSTKSFTCEGVRDYVYDRGAVVMNHKNSSLYRRFVAHAGFCRNQGNSTRSFGVPTRSGRCSLKICDNAKRFRRGRN